jgi:hypothetical protein
LYGFVIEKRMPETGWKPLLATYLDKKYKYNVEQSSLNADGSWFEYYYGFSDEKVEYKIFINIPSQSWNDVFKFAKGEALIRIVGWDFRLRKEYQNIYSFSKLWDFERTKYGIIITKYLGKNTKVVIPEKINDIPVIGIKGIYKSKILSPPLFDTGGIFYNDDDIEITEVIIPNGITGIGDHAFAAGGLKNAVIPESVISIGKRAFSYNDLTSIIIPKNVKSIDYMAFFGNYFEEITIPSDVALDKTAFGYCFVGYYNYKGKQGGTYYYMSFHIDGEWSYAVWKYGQNAEAIITGYSGYDTEITVPAMINGFPVVGVQGIGLNWDENIEGESVFGGIGDIQKLTLAEGICYIGSGAFAGGENIANITIPDSVRTINENAFLLLGSNGQKEISITIGGNVDIIVKEFDKLTSSFAEYYNRNSKRPGTYVFINGNWSKR